MKKSKAIGKSAGRFDEYAIFAKNLTIGLQNYKNIDTMTVTNKKKQGRNRVHQHPAP